MSRRRRFVVVIVSVVFFHVIFDFDFVGRVLYFCGGNFVYL